MSVPCLGPLGGRRVDFGRWGDGIIWAFKSSGMKYHPLFGMWDSYGNPFRWAACSTRFNIDMGYSSWCEGGKLCVERSRGHQLYRGSRRDSPNEAASDRDRPLVDAGGLALGAP